MRAILIIGVLFMPWHDDMKAVSAAIAAQREAPSSERPRIVPRNLPPPQLKDELTMQEMMDQSSYFKMLEEYLRNRPPPQPDLPYGNKFLNPENKKYRIDENAPIKNPWGN